MHRLKILTAAAALLIATPVFAQELRGPDPYANGYEHGYYDNYQRNDFWPGRVAGDVVGGTIGTAGAIATAPFRALNGDPSYAMGADASYWAQRYRSYDPASGTFMGL
jgi:BA14K-like protein